MSSRQITTLLAFAVLALAVSPVVADQYPIGFYTEPIERADQGGMAASDLQLSASATISTMDSSLGAHDRFAMSADPAPDSGGPDQAGPRFELFPEPARFSLLALGGVLVARRQR